MSIKVTGIAASDGFAKAKVYQLVEPDLSVKRVDIQDSASEINRLDQAIDQSIHELHKIREIAAESLGEEEAQVFDAHVMVLSDPELVQQVKDKIESESVNAEFAFEEVTEMFVQMFEAMEDNAYMRERAADIRDVRKRVLAALLGVTLPNPAGIDEEVIVVAHDLTPSDTAQLNKKYVKAFVTNIGGRTSHSAIMARSLEIPAIVGTGDITEKAPQGTLLLVDGVKGEVIINPSAEEEAAHEKAAADFAELKKVWQKLRDEKSVTADGVEVEIAANIGTPRDMEGVLHYGADGVGLYRTEFLYMDSNELPSEDKQFVAYKEVLEQAGDQPVVVRTMDIGGDKKLPYLKLSSELNPFLGYRAIRISLDQDEIFRTQLRALIRASIYGNLHIMFPMIATIEEFKQAKAIFEEEKEKLINESVEISNDIKIGIMVEIPSSAVIADQFAKEVDFFSIGTNDLIQYTMAADRMNERVSYLYQPYSPAILRLIKHVIDSAHKEGIWTGMCGEMAGDPIAVPLLIGLGLDEFSIGASDVLKNRSLIRKLDSKEMASLANKALYECQTAEEVKALVEKIVHQ
ncbi:phosphoenolpyruvate--protein phosphotransferase [Allofustis seminis]|uniref:phosphoenolpyruvate--protein phosphotransferase n=1 Tax=Allofustis seminis TaxID=166939 RepID=UPI00037C3C63|nr:phosphoenolpyruvate--protein phosphotransferase [Allofustis seminis]